MGKLDGMYWNKDKEEFVPYPAIIVAVARAILRAQNDVLDGHVRKTTWEEAQDSRYGLYQAAVAAHKVSCPEFVLEGELTHG